MFEAIELALLQSLEEDVEGDVNVDDEIGPSIADRPGVELLQHGKVELTPIALVGKGGIGAAVADDMLTTLQRGCNELVQMLGPVSGHEKRFGPWGQHRVRSIDHRGAQ